MYRHFLSSMMVAALAFAPALAGQQPENERDTPDKRTDTQQTDRSGRTDQTGAADRTGAREGATDTAARTATTGTLRANERQFLINAAQDGMTEVELGQLAQEKASSQEVKDFGKQMVEEHSQANERLKSIAAEHNVTLPTELQAKHKTQVDRLSKLSGEEFDRAYMQHMVQDHKKAVNLFQKTSKSARNDDVKEFASETLPKLRDHLQTAQNIHSQVAGTRRGPDARTDEAGASRERDTGRVDPKGSEDRRPDQQDTKTPTP